ncbi:hypothetical protein D3C87_1701090 [compost metagenome]
MAAISPSERMAAIMPARTISGKARISSSRRRTIQRSGAATPRLDAAAKQNRKAKKPPIRVEAKAMLRVTSIS